MTASKARGHDHTLQRSFRITLIVALLAICVGFGAGLLVTFSYTQTVNDRLAVLEEYIEGRGEYRDREAERLEQRIDRALCDLLSQLPASALLDEVRARYGCGPGRPIEDFPPEVQREIGGDPAPAPSPQAAPPAEPPPVGMGGAVPDPPRQTPYVPTPGETPAPPEPTPTPDPVVDLGPATDLADDLLCPIVCIDP